MIQVLRSADLSKDLFAGRADHVTSAGTVRFGSAGKLTALVTEVLAPAAAS